jgi:tRNA modification GTPase
MMIELIDTAGFEVPQSRIESQAQSFRSAQAAQADLLLICASVETRSVPIARPAWSDQQLELPVWTKCDIGRPHPDEFPSAICTSAATGEGLEELRCAIARVLRSVENEGDLPTSTGARCRDSLLRAGDALAAASDTLLSGGGEELVAFDIRLALDELGKVVGAVVTDDILDRIFQRFCIGK